MTLYITITRAVPLVAAAAVTSVFRVAGPFIGIATECGGSSAVNPIVELFIIYEKFPPGSWSISKEKSPDCG